MVYFPSVVALLALVSTAHAWDGPSYSGFKVVWQDSFNGGSGESPNSGNWNLITGHLGYNNELETYTSSTRNVQIRGGATVQIVPWQDGSVQGGWSSGRMESKYVFTPTAGGVTRAEAQIRFGTNSIDRKQGIWPAFWMLGDALRHGVGWPDCGEVDALETINGRLTGYGTVHCDVNPGGICNEGSGIGGNIGIPDQGWHTWRVDFDRRSGNWRDHSITWYMDGTQFHQVTGDRINNEGVWNRLCHSPLYFILNVAVGGTWPGNPNDSTQDGYGSMMEVAYVAHYTD
ncbi:Glucan endo-1,3-beta-glucosidase A1 [Tolypocladium ophioglossoides CBS 100239]|uniref:Glucan endo-1,3-beta-glucosidase A1 n=1 Tax=Tolypocladium ophioglossoides (strain CBS 100239) TaxID=1163406 RepID=A0A0L0MZ33_TOLOC|nr:Glucan endo-1,3-beta-glucosidase A1 [Tolypocladium ophioglossoides CBS 100239]